MQQIAANLNCGYFKESSFLYTLYSFINSRTTRMHSNSRREFTYLVQSSYSYEIFSRQLLLHYSRFLTQRVRRNICLSAGKNNRVFRLHTCRRHKSLNYIIIRKRELEYRYFQRYLYRIFSLCFACTFKIDFFLQQLKQVLQFKLHQVVSMIKTAK